jgi:hypothetical protein
MKIQGEKLIQFYYGKGDNSMARRGFTWTKHQLDKLNNLKKRVVEFTASVS